MRAVLLCGALALLGLLGGCRSVGGPAAGGRSTAWDAARGGPAPERWRVFTCSDGGEAFVSAPYTDDEGEAVAVPPAQWLRRLDAEPGRAYGDGATRLQMDRESLEIHAGRSVRRCWAGAEPAERLEERPGLHFVGASTTPVPGWRAVRSVADSTFWLGPDEMRVLPGELDSVRVAADPFTGEPVLDLRMRGGAVARFAALTAAHVDRPIAVVVDGRVLLAPIVMEPITGGRISLSGLSPEEARHTERALRLLLKDEE